MFRSEPIKENSIPLLISLVLHGIFLAVIQTKHYSIPEVIPIDVSIIPALPAEQNPLVQPREQIVSPTKIEESVSPKLTNQISEKDVSVAKEQIKRGQEDAAPKVGKQRKEISSPSREHKKVASPANEPALKTLALDPATVLSKFSSDAAKPATSNTSPGNYKAFSRPSGSGARFIGLQGSSDFLPNLPDGDITLLNAKANKFAVFVRRVALQVFSEIRLQGWDFLSAGDIRSIDDFSTIHAVMNGAGKLVSVTLEGQSGSTRFDEVISKAAKNGTRDGNPPPEAKSSDGNFHFIFKARSWVRAGNEPRHGLPVEYRWLLLSTGLD